MIMSRVANHYLALGLDDPELSVVFTDDAHIHELNLTWRGEDHATDVLSFPLWEADEFHASVDALGDIVISLEYAQRLVDSREHRRRVSEDVQIPMEELDWSLLHEVDFLLIHGLLHLIGHDHFDEEEERTMRAEERRLWDHGPELTSTN